MSDYIIQESDKPSGKYVVYRVTPKGMMEVSGHPTREDAEWKVQEMENFFNEAETKLREKYQP